MRLLAALALTALLLPSAAVKDFQKRWQEAGASEDRKRTALDALAEADKTEEAAKIFLAIAQNENEEASVIDAALRHAAALEGQPGDAWLLAELEKGTKWPERALIARALAYRKTDDVVKPLTAALRDKQWQVVAAAIDGIAAHRVKEAIEPLIAAFEKLDQKDDGGKRLVGDYRDGLSRLTGERLASPQDWRNWWAAHEADFKVPGGSATPRTEKEGITAERSPQLFDEVSSHRVIFILDISGSMQIPTGALVSKEWPKGLSRFEVMRREARRVIGELPVGAHFNVIAFSDAILPWSPKMQVVTEDKKKTATKWVDALKPEGETNSYGALEAAFKDKDVDTIYFLSDGFPTGGKIVDFTKICAEVAKWNSVRKIRLHTIAFLAGDGKPLKIEEGDKSMPKAFMSDLASQNGGIYRLVE
jgi:hypothetical protein